MVFSFAARACVYMCVCVCVCVFSRPIAFAVVQLAVKYTDLQYSVVTLTTCSTVGEL